MKKRYRLNGFTLVEIMIVVAIIGLMATMALPAFVRARENSFTAVCVNNLRIIDTAKIQVAFKYHYAIGDSISDTSQLDEYIMHGQFSTLQEPVGAVYNVEPIGTPPSCSFGNTHAL